MTAHQQSVRGDAVMSDVSTASKQNTEIAGELLGAITAAANAGDALVLGPQSVKNLHGLLSDLLRSVETTTSPRMLRLDRSEAEFIVDAAEGTRIPQWMELAAEVRSLWGMGAFPAGAVSPEEPTCICEHGPNGPPLLRRQIRPWEHEFACPQYRVSEKAAAPHSTEPPIA